MKNKIELKFLVPYFPYKVKAKFKSRMNGIEIGTISQINDKGMIVCYDTVNAYPTSFKLLLHPLSWLTNEVLSDINCDISDQIKLEELKDRVFRYDDLPYSAIKILLENHVDIFNLLERGLAENLKIKS